MRLSLAYLGVKATIMLIKANKGIERFASGSSFSLSVEIERRHVMRRRHFNWKKKKSPGTSTSSIDYGASHYIVRDYPVSNFRGGSQNLGSAAELFCDFGSNFVAF